MKKPTTTPLTSLFSSSQPTVACSILILAIAALLFDSAAAIAQSRVIDVGAGGTTNFSRAAMTNSLPRAFKASEAILQRPPAADMMRCETMIEMLTELEQMGLPVVVHTSALDDTGIEHDIELPMNQHTTASLIKHAFEKFNLGYQVLLDGSVRIVSLDEIGDMKFFTTVVYDVSPWARSNSKVFDLINQIQSTVHRDSWEENGGSGSMVARQQNGKMRLIVSQPYHIHRDLRGLFAAFANIDPITNSKIRKSLALSLNDFSSSRAIELPKSNSSLARRKYSNQTPTGYNGGGGVF